MPSSANCPTPASARRTIGSAPAWCSARGALIAPDDQAVDDVLARVQDMAAAVTGWITDVRQLEAEG